MSVKRILCRTAAALSIVPAAVAFVAAVACLFAAAVAACLAAAVAVMACGLLAVVCLPFWLWNMGDETACGDWLREKFKESQRCSIF